MKHFLCIAGTLGLIAALPNPAQAGEVRVSAEAAAFFQVGGSISVGASARGRVRVGPPPPRRPPPPRSAYLRPVVVAPAAIPLQRRYRPLSVGMYAGSMATESEDGLAQGGLFLRYAPSPRWFLEGDMSRANSEDELRSLDRAGFGVGIHVSPYQAISPYFVLGAGATEAETGTRGSYAELGGGLRWRLIEQVDAVAEIRFGADETEKTGVSARALSPLEDSSSEGYVRARIGAALRF